MEALVIVATLGTIDNGTYIIIAEEGFPFFILINRINFM